MNYYLLPNQKGVFAFDEDQSQYVPENAVLIPNTYTLPEFPFLTLLPTGQIYFDEEAYKATTWASTKLTFDQAAQTNLDKTAVSWGYDSILSAVSYITSNNAQYAAEGISLSNWRDATWEQVYSLESQMASGQIPVAPSPEAFVAMLPAAPERPVTKG